MSYRGSILLALCLLVLLPSAHAQPGPKKSAPAANAHGDPLPDGALARLGTIRFHHEGGVIAAAFSPDSKTIVAAGLENHGLCLRFWERSTGKEISRFAADGFDIVNVAFAPDGKSVFVGRERTVEQYDRATGKRMREFSVKDGRSGARCFAVSPDGQWLATTAETREGNTLIYIWEIATGNEKLSVEAQSRVLECRFSPDSKQLTSTSSTRFMTSGGLTRTLEGCTSIWEVATGKELHHLANPQDSCAIALAPDTQTVVFLDQEGQAKVINAVTGKTVCKFLAPKSEIAFAPDSKSLITTDTGELGTACLWDASTGKEIHRFSPHLRGKQRLVGISPDGKTLAVMTGGWNLDGSIVTWDVASAALNNHNTGHSDAVSCLAFSTDGKLLASGSLDATIRLWDPINNKELACLEGHKAGVAALAFSADGKTLASCSSGDDIRLWDVAKRKETAKLEGPEGRVASLSFAPDGKTLFIGGRADIKIGARRPGGGQGVATDSCSIQAWDVATRKVAGSFVTGPDGTVFAFTKDGKFALSGNGDVRDDQVVEKLSVWSVGGKKALLSVGLRPAEKIADKFYDQIVCWAGAVTSDGRLFAASHSRFSTTLRGGMYSDAFVRVWERDTGLQLHAMTCKAHALAFSPDGRVLAVGHANTLTFHNHDTDSRVTLWDMVTGERIRECKGHGNEITSLAFSPDGKFVASGSADHTIFIWKDFQPPALKRHAKEPTAKQLETWWNELNNAKTSARDAMTEFVAYPEHSVKWMASQLKPAVPADTKLIAKLIDALDSNSFKEREKAHVSLQSMGELPELQLRKALAADTSLERRRRVELLLDKLNNGQVQVIRAVAALEWIATPEAKELLQTLAKGAPEARQTQLAQAALQRAK